MNGLLTISLLAGALLRPDQPLVERHAILKNFFTPEPGQPLSVTARAVAIEKRDPLLVKGELWIKPPAGHCLRVRADYKKRDQVFCKAKPYIWQPYDLDPGGRLHLEILVDDASESTLLTWPTPYRVANYVPLGGTETGDNFNIPIYRCIPNESEGQRKITLVTMDERSWIILLPEFDKPVNAEAEDAPNLLVKGAKAAAPEPVIGEVDPKAKGRPSILSQLLSGDYNVEKRPEFIFHIKARRAFEMASSGFLETAIPQGMQGRCRYIYSDAPSDPASGAIECFQTDTFETIYTHVPCLSAFKPKVVSGSSKRPEK